MELSEWNTYRIFLAILLVTTGSINTIAAKITDVLKAKSRDGKERPFNHPFLQAVGMFLGEILCYILFKILYFVYKSKEPGSEDEHKLTAGNRDFNPIVLLPPAICDILGTSLIYIALNMTYASSFQMFRGCTIFFTGLLSMMFLKRHLGLREWIGMLLVILGLIIVGLSDFISGKDDSGHHSATEIITGDLIIVFATIIMSMQFVLEEKFVAGLDIPPLQAVGWEGIFGFCVLGVSLIPLYFIHAPKPFSNNPRDVMEDVIDAFIQMGNNYLIIIGLISMTLSIAFFNFAGVSITKELSSTTRMVMDSVRTLIVWTVSVSFLGQEFQWLQLVGFIILVYGMLAYNNICTRPCQKCYQKCCTDGQDENQEIQ